MRRPALLFCCVFSLSPLGAQSERGVLAGTVSDPFGMPVASAPLQAKSAADGHVFRTASGKNGQFLLSDLPAGTYDVSVNIPGLKPYQSKGVTVGASQTARLE